MIRSRGARAAVIVLAAVVLLPAAGAIYQSWRVRQETLRFPPPGRLVRVADSGRSLHLVCLGDGSPTVIFEPGGFTSALSFAAARDAVSRRTRVCSYERAGTGWSDPMAGPITIGALAEDLDRLTAQAGLEPPFVLVPSSFGGLTSEMFARRHPEKVAGMVFVDAGNSGIMESVAARFSARQLSSICLAETTARFGVLRALDPFGFRKTPSEESRRSASRLYRVEPMQTFCGLVRGLPASRAEFASAPPLPPDLPLTVLVHDRADGFLPARLAAFARLRNEIESFDRKWVELQQKFAKQSRRGTWRVVPGSAHLIAAEQPQQVAAAVDAMLAEIRLPR